MGVRELHDEPLAEGGPSHLGEQSWGPGEPGATATSGRRSGEGRERGELGGPVKTAGEEQLQVETPWLPTTLQPGQHGVKSGTGPTDPGQPRGGGSCRPGYVKQEEPEDVAQPRVGEPSQPRPIKREEGETSCAEYQEN